MNYEPDDEYDIDMDCPECGSSNVVLSIENGFYRVVKCKKCRYIFEQSPFEIFD
jgi:ssDNA-binding Zn-finger/Zn-ribbon topoisomerase 1